MIAKLIDRPRENSLTAAVVGHLLHLPSEDFWQILRTACPSPNFPKDPGEPIRIHAWPSWNADGTRNSERVIPDLVIEFHAFDLIIEAKRWDRPMQDSEQWKDQLKAYINEYGVEKRQVKMIALGGIHSNQDEPIEDVWRTDNMSIPDEHIFICPVYMCRWSSVLLACQRRKREIEQGDRSSRTLADTRILNDLIDLFIHHGFPPLRWFEDFDFSLNLLTERADADREFFRNASQRFRQI